ncbi:hypothetical protein MTO96_047049 [Rhipicephalus appendiculatus]
MWRAMIGLDTGTLHSAAHSEIPGRCESDYLDSMFAFGDEEVPPLGNLLRLGLEKFLGGHLLYTTGGLCILQRLIPQRNWQPQLYDLESVVALDKVCPTPLIDIYIYKYVAEVPKAFKPFKITYTSEGNGDIYGAESDLVGYLPNNAAGPFIWTDTSKFADVNNDDIVDVCDHSL